MKARPASLLLVVAALVLCLGTGAEAAQGAARESSPIAVRAIAFGGYRGQSVAGARVVVRSSGRVVARGRTGSRGGALLRARPGVGGKDLRVVVVGGRISGRRFGGRMIARFARYHWPRTVYVDSVSTLAARYADAHPALASRRVTRRAHRFLRLPGYYRIGFDGRTNVSFDGRRLLQDVGPGGYDGLISRLVRKMSKPGTHRSFRHLRTQAATASAIAVAPQDATDSVSSVSEAIEAGTGFFSVLEKTNEVLDFTDAIVDLLGSGEGPSKAEIEAISAQLEQVEQSIAVVRQAIGQVEEQAAKRSYSSILREVKPYAEAVRVAESTLEGAIEYSLEHGCSTAEPEVADCALVNGMLTGHGGLVQQIDEGDLSGPGGLATYGGDIAGEAGPHGVAEEEGIVQAGSAMITDRTERYFSAEDSQRVRAIASYWAANFAEAEAIAPLAWALEGDNSATLEHNVSIGQPLAAVMPTLIPEAVPATAVLDVQQGLMWPTALSAAGSSSESVGSYAQYAPWRYSQAGEQWVSVGSGATLQAIVGSEAEALPYENWQVATPAELAIIAESESSGEALIAATGIEQAVVTPTYGTGARGVTEEWNTTTSTTWTGCGSLTSKRCFWPIWAGDGAPVTNLNGGGSAPYETTPYEENELTEYPLPPVYWWGLRQGTLYGNAPIAKVPTLLLRPVVKANCYYYPGAGAPTVGSPGCPG